MKTLYLTLGTTCLIIATARFLRTDHPFLVGVMVLLAGVILFFQYLNVVGTRFDADIQKSVARERSLHPLDQAHRIEDVIDLSFGWATRDDIRHRNIERLINRAERNSALKAKINRSACTIPGFSEEFKRECRKAGVYPT